MDKIISLKKGSTQVVFVSFISIFFILVFSIIYILYWQININIYKVKNDLYYIVQNSVVAFDKEELAYNNYVVNEEEMFKRIDEIMNLNYNNVKLKHLSYDKDEKEVDIVATIGLQPLCLFDKRNIDIKEKVKIKLMEVE